MDVSRKDLPRDVFIETVFQAAKVNRDIVFLCCDLGAKALDDFRVELPGQMIHTGISEQNMMDVAAGLAQCGKTVYAYAMAPFVTFRCFEQIKVALGAMNQPVTVVGVGVGYGYDDAGPTHYATEDLTCMRTIAGMEIHTPADNHSVSALARMTFENPKLRYVRLDRKFLPWLYHDRPDFDYNSGLIETAGGSDVAILSSGFTLHTALKVRERLKAQGISAGVIDIFRLKPLNGERLAEIVAKYKELVSLEEHFLSGGFSSAILEVLNDAGQMRRLHRIGIADKYHFENGGRGHLHQLTGIDEASVHQTILKQLR